MRPIDLARPADVLRPENVITTSACMVRTDKARAAGGFPTSRFSEDLELWMRLLAHGRGRLLPRVTVAYRSHDLQITRATDSPAEADAQLCEAHQRGWLPPNTATGISVTRLWDDARHAGVGATTTLRRVSLRSWPALGLMLLRRAERRHRWRLQARRALAVATLLTDGEE